MSNEQSNQKGNVCQHKTGVMIPQRNIKGDYVKPEFMICDDCRLITPPPTDYTRGKIMN